ncbi:uncharacterized protein BXIN_2744 [Babesia sp. Xinjiang]|uniref:uncharacterized protein n=1 Tax=Babesia sp. Xinjiang TaxID=462227 RepID=UPI000A24FE36|nr:uncharacterized protein BXIN_2744 [Babesia sp. Xinjiang]ORM41712.1 hypothetical protein BXIN_2744 [Babesia sp. Xinjiang]
MEDFLTYGAGCPGNFFRRTCVDSLGKNPDGAIAQFYYLSAKIYRGVNYALQAIPAFKEAQYDEGSGVSCHRVPISAIKSELEDMIKMNSMLSTEPIVKMDGECVERLATDLEPLWGTNASGVSFDFSEMDTPGNGMDATLEARSGEFESVVQFSEDVSYVPVRPFDGSFPEISLCVDEAIVKERNSNLLDCGSGSEFIGGSLVRNCADVPEDSVTDVTTLASAIVAYLDSEV